MFFRKKPPETLPEKFDRLLAFHDDMAQKTSAAIEQFKAENDPALALSNYSHLVHDHCEISVMQWRQGSDPRPAMGRMHAAYREMLAYRDAVDPSRTIPMEKIAGITDWDLVYACFWLIGQTEEPQFHFSRLLDERYFTYSRYLLHRLTDTAIPDAVAAAVHRFQSGHDELVDRNFRDLQRLVGDAPPAGEVDAIVARIEKNWLKRRGAAFYNSSAPLPAGFDVSNDLSVDYQLAGVVKKQGWEFPGNPHCWRWG